MSAGLDGFIPSTTIQVKNLKTTKNMKLHLMSTTSVRCTVDFKKELDELQFNILMWIFHNWDYQGHGNGD